MEKTLLTIHYILFFLVYSTSAQVSVSTQHNNLSRTGENTQEVILNTLNVNKNTFGKIFTREVDDQIYAQPLIISALDIPGKGIKNVVFVATVNNSVYAFDADDPLNKDYFWKTSFLSPGVFPPKNTDMTGSCGGDYQDFSNNMGIVGTPVIDTITKTLYVVARTKEGSKYEQKLHALDITNGKEKQYSPVLIEATYPGTSGTNTFDPQKQNQRPGLLLLNGIVYIGWASHCDWGPYHGWFLGYDAKTLKQKIVYNTTPNGEFGGIWMSGQAPSADKDGNIYLVTGNGTVGDSTNPRDVINRGESSLKLVPNDTGLTVASWFTPHNYVALEIDDIDLGSSGPLLIPNTNLAVFGGKEGIFYVVDRHKMGGLNTTNNDDQIIQSFPVSGGRHFHGSTIYYKGHKGEYIYMWLEHDNLKSYKFDRAKGRFSDTATLSTMKAPMGMPGAVLASSSNGIKENTGIIWTSHPTSGDANHETRPGIIRAFDANDITKELWNSEEIPLRDRLGSLAKFNCPTVANGKLYMGTFSNQLVVYGLTEAEGFYRNSDNPDQINRGLKYKYYQADLNQLPDFASLIVVKQGIVPNFEIGNALSKDTFAYQYTGFINIAVQGNYTFFTNSDDGSNLYIGNNLVVDNDGAHTTFEASGTIGLKPGMHKIRVDYFEKGGGEILEVKIEGPGMKKMPIADSLLYYSNAATAIEKPGMSGYIKVYPNPSDKDVSYTFMENINGKVEVSLYNVLGNKIYSKIIPQVGHTKAYTLDLANFPSGIYSLTFTNNDMEIIKKIVKK